MAWRIRFCASMLELETVERSAPISLRVSASYCSVVEPLAAEGDEARAEAPGEVLLRGTVDLRGKDVLVQAAQPRKKGLAVDLLS